MSNFTLKMRLAMKVFRLAISTAFRRPAMVIPFAAYLRAGYRHTKSLTAEEAERELVLIRAAAAEREGVTVEEMDARFRAEMKLPAMSDDEFYARFIGGKAS